MSNIWHRKGEEAYPIGKKVLVYTEDNEYLIAECVEEKCEDDRCLKVVFVVPIRHDPDMTVEVDIKAWTEIPEYQEAISYRM